MRHILLFSLFSISQIILAQNNCDCAEAQKQRVFFGRNFDSGQFDSAKYYVEKIKDGKGTICDAFYYNWMSQLYTSKKEYDKARQFLDLEYAILVKIKCSNRLARHYTNYSNFYNFINKHDSSIYALVKALEILEKDNDKAEQIRVCVNIGAIFSQLKQPDKSIQYQSKAVWIARQSKDTISMATALTALASSYLESGESKNQHLYYDSARVAASEGLQYAWNKMDIFHILDGYNILGRYNYLIKNFTKGINYSDSIVSICPRQPSFFNRYLQLAFSNKSYCLLESGKISEARTMADSALFFAELFNAQLAIEPLELIYKTSKLMNDRERALWAHERYVLLKDSLLGLEKNAVVAELEGKYNQEKNERRIEKLDQQRKTYLLMAAVIILLTLIVIVYFRQQSLKQKQTLLETEQRLNRSRINPHFFFNVISSLQFLAAKEDDKKKLVTYFFSFSKLMRQTLESSYDEYVNVNQEMEFISHYLKLQELKRAGLFTYDINVTDALDKELTLIPAMILQPFLENSIEHGFSKMESGGKILIKFEKQNSEIVITITDNGKGLQTEDRKEGHVSRATKITTDRLFLINKQKKSNARFTLGNNIGEAGTIVKIFLPLI